MRRHLGVDLDVLLPLFWYLDVRKDRLHGAFTPACIAIDALFRVDVEHVVALAKAVAGANGYTIGILAAITRFGNHISHRILTFSRFVVNKTAKVSLSMGTSDFEKAVAKQSQRNEEKSSVSPAAEINSRELLTLYEQGQGDAATDLFNRYVARLVSLASSRIGSGMRGRIDPEDVVQSAYRSFFVRAAEGDFQLNQSGDLWRLLAQITLNKLYKQAQRHTAARRDFRREAVAAEERVASGVQPTPAEAAALVEQVQLAVERLSGSEREVLSWYLQGQSVEEIANQLQKSARTVRRLLARGRGLIESQLLAVQSQELSVEEDLPPLDSPVPYSDYQLLQLVGAGGMGKVYRAMRKSDGQVVAIKALRKDRQSDGRSVRQFLHEAAVVQRLSHPGIIRIHGLGRFPSGGYFIVMDYIAGSDLQACIDRGRLTLRESIGVLLKVTEAIVHAHQAGIVHCDIKPANVLLANSGEVVVTDFGFAHILADGALHSSIGGTLGYLAPEIAQAGQQPTPAVDIYSLGVLLRNMTNEVSVEVDSVLQSCLSPSPDDRPHSAKALLDQLTPLLEDGGAGNSD